jgi:hypothetical protein
MSSVKRKSKSINRCINHRNSSRLVSLKTLLENDAVLFFTLYLIFLFQNTDALGMDNGGQSVPFVIV